MPILTLYKSLILPLLDYCSLIWSPSSACDLQKMERIQRLVTRSITGFRSLTYWERLQRLKLHSIQRRFERYQKLYVFKCIHELFPNPGLKFSENLRTGIFCQVIVPPRCQKKCVKAMQSSFVMNRAPTLYNSLPKYLRVVYNVSNPLAMFKNDLDEYLSVIPDQPTIAGLSRPANSNSITDQKYYKL